MFYVIFPSFLYHHPIFWSVVSESRRVEARVVKGSATSCWCVSYALGILFCHGFTTDVSCLLVNAVGSVNWTPMCVSVLYFLMSVC